YELFKNIRMFFYIFAHTEECSLNAVIFQCIYNERCNIWYRAVVKGEKDLFFGSVPMPCKRRVKPREKEGSLSSIHRSVIKSKDTILDKMKKHLSYLACATICSWSVLLPGQAEAQKLVPLKVAIYHALDRSEERR